MEDEASWQRSRLDFIQFVAGVFGFFIAVAGTILTSIPAVVIGFGLSAIALAYFSLKGE